MSICGVFMICLYGICYDLSESGVCYGSSVCSGLFNQNISKSNVLNKNHKAIS